MEHENMGTAIQAGVIGLREVSFGYDRPLLSGVTLWLPPSGTICLFGASGCGKTTILRLLCGLEQPQSGEIIGMTGKRAAVVFQENRLLPWRTAADNVALPLGDGKPARAEALHYLAEVGLADAADSRPDALSGGMRRRVAIARALAQRGDLLLLDEPFTGLDEALRRHITGLLLDAYRDRPIVLVTHLSEEAEAFGARVIRLGDSPQSGLLEA